MVVYPWQHCIRHLSANDNSLEEKLDLLVACETTWCSITSERVQVRSTVMLGIYLALSPPASSPQSRVMQMREWPLGRIYEYHYSCHEPPSQAIHDVSPCSADAWGRLLSSPLAYHGDVGGPLWTTSILLRSRSL
jgi:hypothetical protein